MLRKFKFYCINRNVDLLSEDLLYIRGLLVKIPENLHRIVLLDYFYEWSLGIIEEKDSLKTQNKGRLRANLFIRERVNELKSTKS